MESKTGSILALTGGIAFTIAGIFVILSPWIADEMLKRGWASGESFGSVGTIIVMTMGIFYLIASLLIILAGFMMKNPEKVKTGSILALIFGIITLNVLAVVAGIIGIMDAGK